SCFTLNKDIIHGFGTEAASRISISVSEGLIMGSQTGFNRRAILKASGLAVAGGVLLDEVGWASPNNVNTNSSPSTLKITDLRVATVVKPGPSPCPIIRIDTNQDVYGLGEVRDGASPTYALFLKSRILGENPLQLDKLFRKIKQFG